MTHDNGLKTRQNSTIANIAAIINIFIIVFVISVIS